jgi:hypothetical protein
MSAASPPTTPNAAATGSGAGPPLGAHAHHISLTDFIAHLNHTYRLGLSPAAMQTAVQVRSHTPSHPLKQCAPIPRFSPFTDLRDCFLCCSAGLLMCSERCRLWVISRIVTRAICSTSITEKCNRISRSGRYPNRSPSRFTGISIRPLPRRLHLPLRLCLQLHPPLRPPLALLRRRTPIRRLNHCRRHLTRPLFRTLHRRRCRPLCRR